MLFFVAVLAYFLGNVFAEDSEPLPKYAVGATKTAHLLFHDRMEKGWRDDLSEKALQYLKSPDSVKADLITTDKESFKKTDPKPLWYRVFTMVSKLLEQKKEEVLPPILYGCNGVITKGEAEDVLSVACLYTFQ